MASNFVKTKTADAFKTGLRIIKKKTPDS